jgi:hypothetical protein
MDDSAMPKKHVETEPVKRRLNIEIPINFHNRFKAACAKHDRKMVDVVL